MKISDTISSVIAAVIITSIRVGIGYAAAWVADQPKNRKDPADK